MQGKETPRERQRSLARITIGNAFSQCVRRLAQPLQLRGQCFDSNFGFGARQVLVESFWLVGGFRKPLEPRPLLGAYTALTNAILAVVAFAPVLGGVVIQRSGYETLLVATLAVGLAAVFAGGALASTPSTTAAGRRPDPRDYGAARALPAGRA